MSSDSSGNRGRYTICFISTLHPPEDNRVFVEEAVSLREAGFQVIHIAPGPACEAVRDGVTIRTYPSARGPFRRCLNLRRVAAENWRTPSHA